MSAIRHVPKQARSEDRLNALLHAARELCADPAIGPDRFTTAMVAERVGVSIGTVYRYFEDRVAILDVLDPKRHEAAADVARLRAVIRRARNLAADLMKNGDPWAGDESRVAELFDEILAKADHPTDEEA